MTHTPSTLVMPPAIAVLPRNKAGYPIPWFVDRTVDGPDGQPDFRVADSRKLRDAIRFNLCWVCGQRRGAHASFVVGPMCAVNRTSAEPPCHLACATYSARACPFLATPRMVRREHGLPDDAQAAGGMILRNPGVTLVWTSSTFRPYQVAARPADGITAGVLFEIGDPEDASWWAHGRPATRVEVFASIDSGLPTLAEMTQRDGPAAMRELEDRATAVALLVERTVAA